MKKIALSILLSLLFASSFAQRGKDGVGNITGSSIVNSYTTLSADITAGATSITVANASAFSAGDLLMIIQMQGASVNIINGGFVGPWWDANNTEPPDTSYGRVTAYNGAGSNELAEISSVVGNTITIDCGTNNSYFTSGKTQIIRIPRYSSLAISGTGIITCPHWDRTTGTGGVIAIEVNGNTSIQSGGKIDASSLGFHGGAIYNKTTSTPGSTRWGSMYRAEGAHKGESIVGDSTFYKTYAGLLNKGATANGGGGGNSINAGGGGGANAGLLNKYNGGIGNIDTTSYANLINGWAWEAANLTLWRTGSAGGGRGGYTFSSATNSPLSPAGTPPNNAGWTNDSRRIEGGLGGRPLDYSTGSLFLGGGGGAGDYDNGYGGAGGDGGGIIYFLSYGTISGGGSILADGSAGANSTSPNTAFALTGRDGAGGGGGGGAIVVKSSGLVSGITISANGGKGGDNNMRNGQVTASKDAYGPGGGGGGGYIGVPSGTTASLSVAAGVNGIVAYLSGSFTTKIPRTDGTGFPPNGATKGGTGQSVTTITSYSISATGATICSGTTAVLTATVTGTAPNPVTINWYTAEVGGTPLASGSSYTTATLSSNTTYYVGTCPGTFRVPVTVTITAAPAAPSASSPISYCQNATASALSATASGSNTLLWWGTASSGGSSSSSAPTPSTSSVGSTTYYVSQTNGSCEGPRQGITVDVVPAPSSPTATSPVSYCQNETASQLSATPGGGNSLLWWGTASTGGTSSGTATTPSTSTVGSTTYYVSETNGSCESTRTPIVVNVNALPAPPNVADTISYCQNEVASPLTPSGAGITWYDQPTGGSSIPTPTPNTTAVGTTTYYVSETQSGCESARDSIKVVINTSFSNPTVTNASYCLGATATDLSGNVSGATGTLNWYTVPSGGSGTTTAPTPSTASTGTTSYYVSQGSASCESNRSQIDVTVNALPSMPTGTDVSYCENATANVLTASGTGTITWYNTSTGGSSIATPTPATTPAGTTNYYVSQIDGNGCEGARDTVTVTINAIPAPPTTIDTVSYCQNEAASPLTPSGASYTWYTQATGGSGTTTAPTPNTTAVGTTTYYVSETQNGCESMRDSIVVSVNTSFSNPTVTNASYCLGATATDLSGNVSGATGTLNWYTVPSGGSGTTTAPTPSTASTGTTSYYVSQGSASCESNRSQIDVTVNALPSMPTGTDVSYCENATANVLTASGTGTITWYNTSTGGSSIATPTPATTPAGTTNYYVSQIDGNGCEGARDTVTVTINAIPAPPTTIDTVSYCQNEAASPLTPSGASYTWYTQATGGSGTTTAPTPNTTAVGTTTYYVSETLNGCEGGRDSVKVVVNTTFIAPSVNNSTYCAGATATDLSGNVSATGTLNWYATSSGGTASSTAPTPNTSAPGTISYYVSQGTGSCESGRSQIDVTINALPNAPLGTDVTYCINETPVALTASGTGTLSWFTTAVGGTGSVTAPTPSTSTVGTTSYYVSQTDANTCESSRDTVNVTVINLQNAPTAGSSSYCLGAAANQLTATGTSVLNWWGTSASGGTSSATAPTPSTATAGTTTYYVSQGTGACESPRTGISVVVNALPNISFTQDVNNICENACVQFTENASAACTNVAWSFGDGANSSSSGPSHCYTTAGVYDVSVICTDANGCSNTSTVTNAVIVNPSANANFTMNQGTIISPGTTISFVADTGSFQTVYAWSFGEPSTGTLNTAVIYNPSHTYNDLGTYCITLIAGVSPCKDTIQKCIEVIKDAFISIPNIITPNDDALNDNFIITSSGMKSIEGIIFDRWGLKVGSWSGVTSTWDGKGGNGNVVSNGIYYYIIKATDFKDETKEYTGYLQVIGKQ